MESPTKIWIDLDNSPHVPFFKPIIRELERRGHPIFLTARDCFQVCGLADYHGLRYQRIGRHYGKNKVLKVAGLLFRAFQLAPVVGRQKPALALSHGSRSQLIVANRMNIPSIVIFDYEHARGLPFTHPSSVIVPEVIPDSAIRLSYDYVGKYPGIKEDVYVPDFVPSPGILKELRIPETAVVVTIRPPATEAHYHRHQSDELFDAVMEKITNFPTARMVMLPRNEHQADDVRGKWPQLLENGKMIIPDRVVDGLNLIWHSDLVISGGGTMNREAAALGVPVYSIFRGETGIVDRYLSRNGRLTLLETVDDVRSKLQLVKWNRPATPEIGSRPALHKIVEEVLAINALFNQPATGNYKEVV